MSKTAIAAVAKSHGTSNARRAHTYRPVRRNFARRIAAGALTAKWPSAWAFTKYDKSSDDLQRFAALNPKATGIALSVAFDEIANPPKPTKADRKVKLVVDAVAAAITAADAEPVALKKSRASRKPAAPKSDATPKAPRKTAAPKAVKSAAPTAAAPRKRAPKAA